MNNYTDKFLELKDKVKEILLNPPLDLLDSNEVDDDGDVLFSKCNLELVEVVNDRQTEFARYIGSANILIAAYLTSYVLKNEKSWDLMIAHLKTEKFIRDIPSNITNKLKIVKD